MPQEDIKTKFAGGDPKFFAIDKVAGINTKSDRAYIKDEQFSWLENMQPVGDGNYQTLFSNLNIFTPGAGKTIIYMYFFNTVTGGIGNQNFVAIFYSDGTAVSRNLTAATTTTISAVANTFYPGDVAFGTPMPSCVQIGFSGIVIVAAHTANDYWAWDGTTLSSTGGAVPAWLGTGTMPTGIRGTSVEVYQGRVWVADGTTVFFSAPGNGGDFSGVNGGGAFTSKDSFVKREFTVVRQVNGYLYIFGDSSIQVVNNVQSSGTGPVITTFQNLNVDPQSGTPWHNSVQTWGTNLIYANSLGVYMLSGGVTRKISDDLDGIFNGSAAQLAALTSITDPSSAVATINGVKVYMLLIPLTGPFDGGAFRNAVVMWDGKNWFIGSQVTAMTFIATSEVDSQLTANMTEGTNVYQMFQTASGSLTKIWQTKLWSGDGMEITKQALRIFTVTDAPSGAVNITTNVDTISENTDVVSTAVTVTVATGRVISGVGSQSMSMRGNYIGLTNSSTTANFILSHQSVLYRNESPLGG